MLLLVALYLPVVAVVLASFGSLLHDPLLRYGIAFVSVLMLIMLAAQRDRLPIINQLPHPEGFGPLPLERRSTDAILFGIAAAPLGAIAAYEAMALVGMRIDGVVMLIALVIAQAPSLVTNIRIARTATRARAKHGRLCPNCRYDLTGRPDIGTCPECGNAYDPRLLRYTWWVAYGPWAHDTGRDVTSIPDARADPEGSRSEPG